MGKVRLFWIDWMRIISIFLIVFGHLPLEDGFVKSFIYSFHVPVFFVISGFLFKNNKSSKDLLLKDCRQLIVPYLFFCLIYRMFWFSTFYIRYTNLFDGNIITDGFLYPILHILLGINNHSPYAMGGPVWFLIALFGIKQLYNKLHVKMIFPISIICVLICFILPSFEINKQYSILCMFLGFPFFALGAYLKREKQFDILMNKMILQKKLSIIVLLISFLMTSCFSYLNGPAYMYIYSYGSNIFYFFVASLSGIAFVFSISILLNNCRYKFIVFLSEGTLVILGLHAIVIRVIQAIPSFIHDTHISLILSNIVYATLIIIVLSLPIFLFNKFLPIAIGKR